MKKWIPHNYQLTALSFLICNPRSGLFLDPGLGKTSTSLAAIKILIGSDKISSVLMIAPLRVTYSVWPSEIEKWINFNNLTCTILHEDNKHSLWGKRKDIYLINPEGIEWLHGELLTKLRAGKKCPFNTLWIDESTRFKSAESKRFGFLVDMLPLFKRRHIMTGTPVPKGLIDIWSQMYILDDGKTLGNNYHKFRNKYFETNDWDKYTWRIKDFSDEIIKDLISPYILEMACEDYLDMPEISNNNIMVQLPSKSMKYYKQMERDFFIEIDELEASAQAKPISSMKCHQIANGNVYEDIPEELDDDEIREFKKTRKVIHVHKAKIEVIKDLIEELNGKPLLIAYHYKHDLSALLKLLGKNTPYIGSGVSAKKSKQLENDWNSGKISILLGHPDSMAHGLNFQEQGNDICWYSLTWNLENYLQFIARIYRQGIKGKYMRVHHLIAEGTVDEAMMIRLGERANDQKSLRDALKEYRKGLK